MVTTHKGSWLWRGCGRDECDVSDDKRDGNKPTYLLMPAASASAFRIRISLYPHLLVKDSYVELGWLGGLFVLEKEMHQC